MTPEQIFATIAALLSGSADPSVEHLAAGGFDDKYPVAIEQCELSPGTFEVEGQTVICGSVSVPENYAKPDGRRIPLEFAILKATSMSPASDPLVYLHGGPGIGTLFMLGPVADELYANHRRDRDIITFDQRASALSASTVVCYEEMADHIVELVAVDQKKLQQTALNELIAPCVEEIVASGADLSAYNTANNARDVRALVSALGHETYNIYGISYGTKLALEVLRSEPDGVRSVVIDGVAPPTVAVYDELFVPYADALDVLVAQCKADDACAAAYPDLGNTIEHAFEKIAVDPLPAARGQAEFGFEDLFQLTFGDRNNRHITKPITAYLPRIFSELSKGDSTALDALLALTPPDRIADLSATKGLTKDERALVISALESAQAMEHQTEGVIAALDRLKRDLREDRENTSIAEAFEARSTTAARALVGEEALVAAMRDYALLQTEPPRRQPLINWINTHFQGADADALLGLVSSMSDADITRTFEIADGEASKYEAVLGQVVNVLIYACQEDRPRNSRENFKKTVARLAEDYEFLTALTQSNSFYDSCEAFEMHPREGFHDAVSSDVPVLILNGTKDVQTSSRWGAVAAETLTNARNYVIPEAGHGTISYQQCPNDMSVSFLNNPGAPLDASCIDRISVVFVMPDDPLPKY